MGPNMTAVITALAVKYHISVTNSLNIEQDAYDHTPYNDDVDDVWA